MMTNKAPHRKAVNLLSVLILSCMSLSCMSLSCTAQDQPSSNMSYLDNGVIRIGINLDIGGAITYLSESGSGENIVNSHDWGRQIQMSFYSGPNPFTPNGKEPSPVWKFLGWNPIQSGDAFGNRSEVIEHTNDGESLYVKCVPMQWPLDNEPGECTFEVWIRLEDNAVQVRSKLTNAREDHTQYHSRGQELPAVYSNGTYYRLFTYDGDAPFTGGPVRRITKVWDTRQGPQEVEGGPWDHWYATENWAALVREDDWGVGIWSPDTYAFTGGFAGTPGAGGPKDGPTGYIAPTRQEILDRNIEYEYDYTLIVGNLEEIRDYVYREAERKRLPHFTFETGRESWTLRDCEDDGPPTTGTWPIRLTGPAPRIIGPDSFWQTDNVPTIYIRAAFDTGRDRATLRWECYQDGETRRSGATTFDVIPDGTMRTYAVNLSGLDGYAGASTRLVLAPETDGSEGRSVAIERISYRSDP